MGCDCLIDSLSSELYKLCKYNVLSPMCVKEILWKKHDVRTIV